MILYLLALYALIGGIAMMVIARMRPDQKKDLWVKYIIYLLLIVVVIGAILLGPPYRLALTILLGGIGLVEIIKVGIQGRVGGLRMGIALFVYGIMLVIFFHMMDSASTETLLITYFLVVVFDAFSQISGQLFGKRKLTKKSPNKTAEGLLGGMGVTLITVGILWAAKYSGTENLAVSLAYASLVCLIAFGGDILASWYKRVAGVKDFSRILPGHGGILDRYDSFLAAGIVYFIFEISGHGSL